MKYTEENAFKSTELFTKIENYCIEIRERKQNLTSLLSVEDKKKTDIEHYIEFYSLSASQGYKMYKILKDCLEERRKIKDELEMIDDILRMNIGFVGKGKGNEVVEKAKNKQYKPRVLKDLFEKR